MKKFVAIFISFILIFTLVVPSYANLIEGLEQVKPTDTLEIGTEDITGTDFAYSGVETGSPNAILQIIADTLESLATVFMHPARMLFMNGLLPTIEGTIWAQQTTFQLTFFNDTVDAPDSRIELMYSSIGDAFRGLVGSLYNGFRYLVAAVYIIILVYLGIRMILSSIGKQKAHYKTLLQYWLIGLLLLFAFHWVMAFIIWISYQLTFAFADLGAHAFVGESIIYEDLPNRGMELSQKYGIDGFEQSVTGFILNRLAIDAGIGAAGTAVASPLGPFTLFGVLLLLLALIVISIVLAFTYLKRLLTVAFLIIIFPIVVLSYVFDKIGDRRAQTFSTWFREFTVNVFVQPIHAFLLAVLAYILQAVDLFSVPIIGAIFCLLSLSLIPIGERQIKTLFQINSSMGPGNGGLATSMGHTLAHAGMAARTIGNAGRSAMNLIKNIRNNDEVNRYTNDKLSELDRITGRSAEKEADRRNLTGRQRTDYINGRKRAAREKFLNSASYKKYVKDKTGFNSLDEAQANMRLKLASGTIGATLGFASAIASSSTVGELGQNMLARPISGVFGASALANAYVTMRNMNKPESSPELDEAEKLASGNIDKLSKSDKEKLSKITGIHLSLIKEDNKDLINDNLTAMRQALNYGMKIDDPCVQFLNPKYCEIENLKNGLNPNGVGKVNWDDYEAAVTKDATYLRDKHTNRLYKLDGFGNPNAGDEIIWGDINDKENKKIAKKLEDKSQRFVDEMAEQFGFEKDSKRYNDLMNKETNKNATILKAHSTQCATLRNMSGTLLTRPGFSTLDSISAGFTTTDDVFSNLSADQLADVNMLCDHYTDDMVFNPNDATSKERILKKVAALDAANFQISFDGICKSVCGRENAYAEYKKGNVSDDEFREITETICKDYSNLSLDARQIGQANVLNMVTNANQTIDALFGDTTRSMSREAINVAVSDTLGIDISQVSQKSSTELRDLMYSQNIETKQNIIQALNVTRDIEYNTNPEAGKIIQASNNGRMTNTVNISSAPANLAQMFNVVPGEKVLVSAKTSPIDPTTGKATTILTSIGDSTKSVTIETDIDTGGAFSFTQGGELTLDANGNLQLNCTEELTDLPNSDVPSTPNSSEPFNEFTLDQLQAMCGNTNATEFTLVKNSVIYAILDQNGQYHGIHSDSQIPTDSPMEFHITQDASGNLVYTAYPLNVDKRYKLVNHSLKSSDTEEVSLINRLLNRKSN